MIAHTQGSIVAEILAATWNEIFIVIDIVLASLIQFFVN